MARYEETIMLKAALTALLVAAANIPGPTTHASPTPLPRVDAIYSHRALYHARLILQLRLLEARGEGLTRLRKLLEDRLRLEPAPQGLDYSHFCD